jgi:predicted phage baseplate assembly protein
VSVARGNVVLADHGRTVTETASPIVAGRTPVELRLLRGPLTHQAPPSSDRYVPRRPLSPPRRTLAGSVDDVIPAVVVKTSEVAGIRTWIPVPDLLDSTPSDLHFVAEPGAPVEGAVAVPLANDADAGSGGAGLTLGAGAVVRFGEGTYGADPESGRPPGTVTYEVTYRVGNGPSGAVGAETLVHIAAPAVAGGWPTVTAVRNPLPAIDGTAPQPVAEARLAAPVAFSVDQRRAVTEADYAAAARRLASVQGAVATFRWTGSWLTVFVGIDPADPADLVDLPDGRSILSSSLDLQVRIQLERFRQAGYDLEIRPPTFVPLDIVLDICVKVGHFRSEVLEAVRRAMGRSYDEKGRPAYFNPIRWRFGQPVWLSSVYAAVEAVAGVDNVDITRFRRLGFGDNGELDSGRLQLGAAEIARCDNDPDFGEHGTLTVTASGGKG